MNDLEFELDVQLQTVLVRENYGFLTYIADIKEAKAYIADIASNYSTIEINIIQIGDEEFGVVVMNRYRTDKLSAVG